MDVEGCRFYDCDVRLVFALGFSCFHWSSCVGCFH